MGCYLNEDGTYSTTVTIDGEEVSLSDGAWGCIAYSAITSLYEADLAMAFEYYLDTDYTFGSDFQAQLAEYLSEAYMAYINGQNLTVAESDVGFDLDGDGELNSTVALTIEYDLAAYPDTNGYGGTYLDLYLAEFISNLQWYLDNLDYAEGWTWFDADGNALSDAEVAAMTTAEKAEAFLEGRYASATGTDLSGWVDYSDVSAVSFSLADAVSYRTAGASKAIPGFDVIDYGQEDYVFGSATQDARHWNAFLLQIFQEYADTLAPLFNAGA